MLTAYRRHLSSCPHREKGQSYSFCQCPIWCYGTLGDRQIRQSMRTNDAARALHEIRRLENGDSEKPEKPAPTVAISAGEFLGACKGRGLRESTIGSYTTAMGYFTATCGTLELTAVNVPVLEAYRKSRQIALGTWRKELQMLRGFFAWCMECDWIDRNPARRLKMPRVEELTTQPFTHEEILRLLDAACAISTTDPGEVDYVRRRARALVYTSLYSGLRISDIAQLERSALEGRHLTLRVLKTGVRQKVLLHPSAADSLIALPAQNPKYFFWTGNGDIITCIKNLRRTIQRLGHIAKVHAHPHRFRDTFAVELLSNGADIRTVSKLLGHNSIRTTEKHYAHFVAAHQALLDSAASTLDFERSALRPLAIHTVVNRRRNS